MLIDTDIIIWNMRGYLKAAEWISPVGWAKRAFFCEHAHADFAFARGHKKRAHPTWLSSEVLWETTHFPHLTIPPWLGKFMVRLFVHDKISRDQQKGYKNGQISCPPLS